MLKRRRGSAWVRRRRLCQSLGARTPASEQALTVGIRGRWRGASQARGEGSAAGGGEEEDKRRAPGSAPVPLVRLFRRPRAQRGGSVLEERQEELGVQLWWC